jgi:outer membrane protein assembly factor BamB
MASPCLRWLAWVLAIGAPAWLCAAPPAARPVPIVADVGEVLWRVSLPELPSYAPAADEHAVYVAMRDGILLAARHTDGDIAWMVPQPSTLPLAAADGLVVGAQDTRAWAVDATTGDPRWEQEMDATLIVALASTAAGFVCLTDRNEAALLAQTDGHVLWRQSLGAKPQTLATMAGEEVWVGLEDGRVLALRLQSGLLKWTGRVPGAVLALTPLADRLLASSADRVLSSMSLRDGKVNWRWRTGGDLVGAPAADARQVYVVARDNMLRALDRRNGTLRWQRPVKSRPTTGPVLQGDVVVATLVAQQLQCFDAIEGTPGVVVELPGRGWHLPYIAPYEGLTLARLVFVTAGGQLLAVGKTIEPKLVRLDLMPGKTLPAETLPPIIRGRAAAYADPGRPAREGSMARWTTRASRLTPSTMRVSVGAENDSRMKCWPLPSTKKAAPAT